MQRCAPIPVPLGFLRSSIHLYRSPKKLVVNDVASIDIHAEAGVLDGVLSATIELRPMFLEVRLQQDRCHSGVSLNVFRDDNALDATAEDKHAFIDKLADAASDMAHCSERAAMVPTARSKSAVLSNDPATAKAMRNVLGDLGGPASHTVRALGCGVWSAAPGAARAMPVRAMRFSRAPLRRRKLRALKSAAPNVAAKVSCAASFPLSRMIQRSMDSLGLA